MIKVNIDRAIIIKNKDSEKPNGKYSSYKYSSPGIACKKLLADAISANQGQQRVSCEMSVRRLGYW